MHAVPAGSADSVELAGDVCGGVAAAAAAAAASIAAAAGAEAAIGQRSNTLAHTQRSRHAHAHAQSHTPYATLRVRHLSVTAMRAYACCWMCEVRREVLRLLLCRFGAIRARCAARDSRSAARARERGPPCAALVAAVRNALAASHARTGCAHTCTSAWYVRRATSARYDLEAEIRHECPRNRRKSSSSFLFSTDFYNNSTQGTSWWDAQFLVAASSPLPSRRSRCALALVHQTSMVLCILAAAASNGE